MKLSITAKYLFIIFLIAFILFSPSLKVFYTNDDFFLLKISQANSLREFVNFFNLTKGPEGLGMYRPLTTQVFYFFSWKVFNLNPAGLHAISFLVFFAVIYLVYLLAKNILLILNSKFAIQGSLLVAFLYATSATHFGHLYYLAAFQELGMAFFFLFSTISFINFLTKAKNKDLYLSILCFALSLLSKETAVVLPFVLTLIWIFLKFSKVQLISLKKFVLSCMPYCLILFVYLYMRFAYYGFAQGESYIWDFSIGRAVNTLGWYGLWSLNLPEMLVDFVGSGLRFNPNLFKFWSKEIIPIFASVGIFLLGTDYLIFKNTKKLFLNRKSLSVILFCTVWFIVTLIPVLFLPLHKFTFYLTLPLLGVVFALSYLLEKRNLLSIIFFCILWTLTSILTLNLTRQTHWIIQGETTAKRVYDYFQSNRNNLVGKTIIFYDTKDDETLPFGPTATLKNVLSINNFFDVYYDGRVNAIYGSASNNRNEVMIKSRMFLGY